MGNNITHFAHKADVLRLLAMRHSGGVYLDIDMFVYVYFALDRDGYLLTRIRTKSFDDLMYFPTTLGMESATESYRSPLDPEGLCVSLPASTQLTCRTPSSSLSPTRHS
jgi:hypothetical protein